MLMQLEMLPEWSIWANQRINSPGGPTSQEYEVTESELDWFVDTLACVGLELTVAILQVPASARARLVLQPKSRAPPERVREESFALLADAPTTSVLAPSSLTPAKS
jgi:hypothetical protein